MQTRYLNNFWWHNTNGRLLLQIVKTFLQWPHMVLFSLEFSVFLLFFCFLFFICFFYKYVTHNMLSHDSHLIINIALIVSHSMDTLHVQMWHKSMETCSNKNIPSHDSDQELSWQDKAVLALTVKIRKSQDFLAPISGSPGDQFFFINFQKFNLNILKLSFME